LICFWAAAAHFVGTRAASVKNAEHAAGERMAVALLSLSARGFDEKSEFSARKDKCGAEGGQVDSLLLIMEVIFHGSAGSMTLGTERAADILQSYVPTTE
jgi:hypothetical protein